ncbi:MAG: hypothetical protein QOE43_335 [Gaiellaceae bacterium]|nr:hypothetical protein [Gaiellaceae bacterium]
MTLVTRVEWSQPQRLLGELRSDSGRTTIRRDLHGVVESTGDARVRRVSRQREVAGAKQRVLNDICD